MARQTWESCAYSAEEERDFLKNDLGLAMKKAGLGGQNIPAKQRPFQRVRYTQLSKDDVEAAAKKSMIGREEFTEARVGGIGTHIARVEVVGCIEYSQRQSQAILLRHLKLFRYFGVNGEECRKPCPVRIAHADEILFRITHRIREART